MTEAELAGTTQGRNGHSNRARNKKEFGSLNSTRLHCTNGRTGGRTDGRKKKKKKLKPPKVQFDYLSELKRHTVSGCVEQREKTVGGRGTDIKDDYYYDFILFFFFFLSLSLLQVVTLPPGLTGTLSFPFSLSRSCHGPRQLLNAPHTIRLATARSRGLQNSARTAAPIVSSLQLTTDQKTSH